MSFLIFFLKLLTVSRVSIIAFWICGNFCVCVFNNSLLAWHKICDRSPDNHLIAKTKYGMAWLKVQYLVVKYLTVNLLHSYKSCLLKLIESIGNYTFVYIPLCIFNFGHCKLHFCQHRWGLSPQEIDGDSFWMIVGIHWNHILNICQVVQICD